MTKETTDRDQLEDSIEDEIQVNNEINDDEIVSKEDAQMGKTVINIELKNGIGKSQENTRRVIRCVRFKVKVDPENDCRKQLFFFTGLGEMSKWLYWQVKHLTQPTMIKLKAFSRLNKRI
jgi:hypothetical protein